MVILTVTHPINSTMTASNLQEQLVKLFLRLNGYLTSGLIIHSNEKGNNKTELDVIAVRFPYHKQIDRQVNCSKYLEIPISSIDIIIGEVKGRKAQANFNAALHSDKEAIKKLVNWLGMFSKEQISKVESDLYAILQPRKTNSPHHFDTLKYNFNSSNFTIRPILFCPDRPKPKSNQTKYVYGQVILDYIWQCLRPETLRKTCSTIYPTNMWGYDFTDIVEYFKKDDKKVVGTMKDLYNHFEINLNS